MEDEIEKLLAEYSTKIANVERLLNHLKTKIPYLRREKKDYTSERMEQARLFAQLNAYHQASADIDSLLDRV